MRKVLLYAIISAAVACTDASGPQALFPDKIVRADNSALTGNPGFSLPDSIRVRVVDGSGRGVPGQSVTFAVTSGGGSASPTEVTTDSAGAAATLWTLGPAVGSNQLQVTAGDHSLTLTATATTTQADTIIRISGGSTDLKPGGCTLGDPLVVKVTDHNGQPIANAEVEFDAVTGGGHVTPDVAQTAADGTARGTWTLGGDGGANVVHAVLRAGSRPSVEFDATSTMAAPNGFSTLGNKIYDPATCAPIIFHGMTRPSLQWQSDGDVEMPNIAKDAQLMKSWGANIMRLPITQTFWMPGNHEYDPSYKPFVISLVQQARAQGIAVIVDLHASDRGDTAFTATPDDQKMPDRNISLPFWRDVAATFKNDGGVIFELYNEPHEISWDFWLHGGFIPEGEDYPGGPVREAYNAVGMQELYDAVRAAGARNLVLLGGLHWAFFLDSLQQYGVKGYNIAYVTHPYDWPDKQEETWDEAFGNATSQFPILIGEFGAYNCDRLVYDTHVMDYADQKGIGWLAWAWWTPPPVSATYTEAQRETDICHFPALITDWSGTPSPPGQLIKARMATYRH